MCDLIDLDKKSDKYIRYYELFEYFESEQAKTDQSDELKNYFLQNTNQAIAFVDKHYCVPQTDVNPVFKYHYRVVHKYKDFKDFEHIALGCNEQFNASLDMALARIFKDIIGTLAEEHEFVFRFLMHDPHPRGFRFVMKHVTDNFKLDLIRNLLLKQDWLINLLVTKKITFAVITK